jgi:hypothetical protein
MTSCVSGHRKSLRVGLVREAPRGCEAPPGRRRTNAAVPGDLLGTRELPSGRARWPQRRREHRVRLGAPALRDDLAEAPDGHTASPFRCSWSESGEIFSRRQRRSLPPSGMTRPPPGSACRRHRSGLIATLPPAHEPLSAGAAPSAVSNARAPCSGCRLCASARGSGSGRQDRGPDPTVRSARSTGRADACSAARRRTPRRAPRRRPRTYAGADAGARTRAASLSSPFWRPLPFGGKRAIATVPAV